MIARLLRMAPSLEILKIPIPPPPKPRQYYPNREPYVVLECGCVTTMWLHIHDMTTGKDYQSCDNHPESESEHGQRILRRATVAEQFQFFELGKPVPKRRNGKTPDWVRIMSEHARPEAGRARPEIGTLF